MKKHNFHFSAKEFFGFFIMTEHDTEHIADAAHKLGKAFSASAQPQKYGVGVKHIAVGLILTDPEGLGRLHKVKRPKYSAGVKTIKAHGLTVTTEDSLEFDLRPLFADVRKARTESELATAILPTIAQVMPELKKLKIPDFDSDLFLADFENFLEDVKTRGVYTH